MAYVLGSSAFRLRDGVEIDDLVLGLESSTFRVRVLVRIP